MASRMTKVFEALTVGATAVGFTKTTMDQVYSQYGQQLAGAIFSINGADIRVKYGSDPTAGEGTILKDGDLIHFDTEDEARNARFIRTGAISATLDAVFLRAG